jgi:hypothetical protein
MRRLDRAHRAAPVVLGAVTLATVVVLFAWDAFPRLFPTRAHDVLGALPLCLIALAYLTYQVVRRPSVRELAKAILLAIAFLFWGANQCWPDVRSATVFNDMAIALFVLDVFLVIVGWPANIGDESFGETHADCDDPASSENIREAPR